MYYNYTCLYLLYALYFHLITRACIRMLHYIAFFCSLHYNCFMRSIISRAPIAQS